MQKPPVLMSDKLNYIKKNKIKKNKTVWQW